MKQLYLSIIFYVFFLSIFTVSISLLIFPKALQQLFIQIVRLRNVLNARGWGEGQTFHKKRTNCPQKRTDCPQKRINSPQKRTTLHKKGQTVHKKSTNCLQKRTNSSQKWTNCPQKKDKQFTKKE